MVRTLTPQGMSPLNFPPAPPSLFFPLVFISLHYLQFLNSPPNQDCPFDTPVTRTGTLPRRSSEHPVPLRFISLAQTDTLTLLSSYFSMVPTLTEPINMVSPRRPSPESVVTKSVPKPSIGGSSRRIKTSGTALNTHTTALHPQQQIIRQESIST